MLLRRSALICVMMHHLVQDIQCRHTSSADGSSGVHVNGLDHEVCRERLQPAGIGDDVFENRRSEVLLRACKHPARESRSYSLSNYSGGPRGLSGQSDPSKLWCAGVELRSDLSADDWVGRVSQVYIRSRCSGCTGGAAIRARIRAICSLAEGNAAAITPSRLLADTQIERTEIRESKKRKCNEDGESA